MYAVVAKNATARFYIQNIEEAVTFFTINSII